MATTSGHPTDPLIAKLEREPHAFDFFRAVRLLEAQAADRPRLGHSLSPADDPVRFGQNPSLAFPSSTMESYRPADEQRPAQLLVRFMGVFGSHGPMPLHFTEYAHERQINFRDQTLARFLDVFHHRMISFFYRAWACNQKALDLDRADRHYRLFVGSIFGLGMPSLQDRDAVPDLAKLFFAGRLACQTRNAEGLAAIVQDFFGIPAQVQQFIGQWMELPAPNQCRLGESPRTGSLGQTTIIGSQFWDCQLKFRVRLGPMSYADYRRLLPTGDSFERLKAWVLNYTGEEFFWDSQLVLKADEAPDTRLGQSGELGWTTWLKTGPLTCDPDDLTLTA